MPRLLAVVRIEQRLAQTSIGAAGRFQRTAKGARSPIDCVMAPITGAATKFPNCLMAARSFACDVKDSGEWQIPPSRARCRACISSEKP